MRGGRHQCHGMQILETRYKCEHSHLAGNNKFYRDDNARRCHRHEDYDTRHVDMIGKTQRARA